MFSSRTLQEPINCKRVLRKPIEDKPSWDTESNGDKALSARLTCGSAFCQPNVQANPAAAERLGIQNTRDPPLGLSALLGDCSVAAH